MKDMRIIIVGSGKLGSALTRQLSAEECDITLIDQRMEALEATEELYDVITLQGNGASMKTLQEADVSGADLLIAVTGEDEVNLLCCMTAHSLNKNLHTIARIRNPEYWEQASTMRELFGLSLIVNPERMAAREIDRILKYPGFLRVDTFANGRMEIVELRIDEKSPLSNVSLIRMSEVVGTRVLVCAVVRSGECLMPGGDFVLQPGDNIFVTASRDNLAELLKSLGIAPKKVRQVVVAGGGRVSYYLAEFLVKSGTSVEIIERDEAKCLTLAERLPKAQIIHGDASKPTFMDHEAIEKADALVALTGLDELNILISLYGAAKHIGKRIVKLGRYDYSKIIGDVSVGSVISPKELSSNVIARYVRAMRNQTGSAVTIHTIANGQAEAVEFVINKNCRHCGEPLRNLPIKSGILVAGISHKLNIEIPGGASTFEEGDSVVVVCSDKNVLYSFNDIFEE